MKILLWTDNHFCASSSIVNSKGKKYSTRLENQLDTINWVEELSIKENCKLEIHLGDFFDKPNLTSQELSALKEIKWNCIEKEFICGNHEMGSYDLTFNSVNALSNVGNVVIKPTLIADEYCNIIMIPYILESERKPLKEYIDQAFEESEETYNRNNPIIVLSHNDIKGIQYGGFESKQGFSVDEIEENCTLFLNGHLHNGQFVGSNIYLLGNITGQNFSEDAFKYRHGAFILDTETSNVIAHTNPYALNFYKLDFTNKTYLGMASELGYCQNGIITVKVKSQDVEELRNILLEFSSSIIQSRVVVVNDAVVNNQNTIIDTVNINHIDKFKTSFREKEGTNEIIEEELGRL